MLLSGNKIQLRAVEPQDLDALYIFENDSTKAESSFVSAPVSRNMLWEYVKSYSADIFSERQLRLMIVRRDDNAVIGTVDITDFDPRDRRGFVGIYIVEGARGQGHALEALQLLVSYARDVLGMHQLAAVVGADNEASRRLFAAAGFKTCGCLRSWIRRGRRYGDAVLYQLLFTV